MASQYEKLIEQQARLKQKIEREDWAIIPLKVTSMKPKTYYR